MSNEAYDLIGDIHGEAAALRDLLERLGYKEKGGCYRRPDRRVIFLGDYIDRGPAIRETLQIVRRMVDDGGAVALCGNHELDVLMHDTPSGPNRWLRPHGGRMSAMHVKTHAEFADRQAEWREWLRWIQTLPLYLDLPGLRAVHAYWNSKCIAALGGHSRFDDELLFADRHSKLGAAAHLLLKGPEVPLPPGFRLPHPTDSAPDKIRVRWWLDGHGRTYREACIYSRGEGPDRPIPSEYHALLMPPDPDDTRPVFIGHYWLPPQAHPALLTPKVACLDFSVAGGGPLMAYRWDGERVLSPEKFVFNPDFQVGNLYRAPSAVS